MCGVVHEAPHQKIRSENIISPLLTSTLDQDRCRVTVLLYLRLRYEGTYIAGVGKLESRRTE